VTQEGPIKAEIQVSQWGVEENTHRQTAQIEQRAEKAGRAGETACRFKKKQK
jgi:hypothetical protein